MKGKITISKTYCSQGDNFIRVAISDATSGVDIVEVRISITDFG